MHAQPGVARLGRYEIERLLGAGGMAEVYRARDLSLQRSVALKLLPSSLISDASRMQRFAQEARAASALNHPNIVHVDEIGDATDGKFIAMELVDGETLRKKLNDNTSLQAVLLWLTQVADGMQKAHGAGIVHSDLKPENIMVSHDGFAKILDFGLAK